MLEGYQSDQRFTPDIIVIDSLNIVEGTDRGDFFQQFQSVTSSGGKIVVFVLDSSTTGDAHAIWEYACDVVIRLDYGTVNNYYMRTIEVVKARYQSHIWGKHQLKIYEVATAWGDGRTLGR